MPDGPRVVRARALLTEELNNTRTKLPGDRRPLVYQIAEARISTKTRPLLQEVGD